MEVLTEEDTSSCKVGLLVARSDNDKKQKAACCGGAFLELGATGCQGARPNDGKWRCTFTGSTERNQTEPGTCPCAVIIRRGPGVVQLSATLLCWISSIPLHLDRNFPSIYRKGLPTASILEMTSAVISPETKGLCPKVVPVHITHFALNALLQIHLRLQ